MIYALSLSRTTESSATSVPGNNGLKPGDERRQIRVDTSEKERYS